MEKNKTVYKLYKDAMNKPKEIMYTRPLYLGIGTSLGGIIGYNITSNDTLVGLCAGATIIFLGSGIYNFYKFNKKKKHFEISRKRLEIFEEEAKKSINKDVNLDYDNVFAQVNLSIPKVNFEHYNTMFKDGGCIIEDKQDDLSCCEYFFSDNEGESASKDLKDALDIAYKKVPSSKKKN